MDKEVILLRIDEIIKQIDIVTNDFENLKLDDLKPDSLLGRATAFSIEQICEHMSKLKKIFENDWPSIPWNKIYDTRIVIAHMYLKIEPKYIYETVKKDLPSLRAELLKLKESLK